MNRQTQWQGIRLISIGVSVTAGLLLVATGAFAEREQVVAKKTKTIAGQTYTFSKLIDSKGNTRTEIRDRAGQPISAEKIPQVKPSLIQPELSKLLKSLKASGRLQQLLQVNIALNLPAVNSDQAIETGEAQEIKGEIKEAKLNGKAVESEQLAAYTKVHARKQQALQQRQAEIQAKYLMQFAERYKLQDQAGLKAAMSEGRSSLTVQMTAEEVLRLAEVQDKAIAGIELFEKGEDDIASAMNATSISTSALPNASTRGSGIGIYMTESGCANESRISNYDRLSGSETNHARNVGAIIRSVSPASFLYCRGGAVLPQNSDLDGVGGKPPIHIVTRSNSSNDSTSYNTLDRDWDNFAYRNNIAVFNSGGNTGNGTGNVRSPGKGLNIITVGNYSDANNSINSSSPFVDPNIKNDKPEIAAPGTSITAGGFTMGGTSQSTPHAAAFTADMMSSSTYLQYRPYLAKAKLLAGATDGVNGGFDRVGLGGIDFASAQWSGYWAWFSGGNRAFTHFDKSDGSQNGYIEKRVYISRNWERARIALGWMNRGSYTYNNRNNAHPIGMDLDMKVYDPDGNYIGGSFSWDNSFESVNFTPRKSGYYTVKVNRFANRDRSLNFRMGLYVNYYN